MRLNGHEVTPLSDLRRHACELSPPADLVEVYPSNGQHSAFLMLKYPGLSLPTFAVQINVCPYCGEHLLPNPRGLQRWVRLAVSTLRRVVAGVPRVLVANAFEVALDVLLVLWALSLVQQ